MKAQTPLFRNKLPRLLSTLPFPHNATDPLDIIKWLMDSARIDARSRVISKWIFLNGMSADRSAFPWSHPDVPVYFKRAASYRATGRGREKSGGDKACTGISLYQIAIVMRGEVGVQARNTLITPGTVRAIKIFIACIMHAGEGCRY